MDFLEFAVENFKVNVVTNGWILSEILTKANPKEIKILKKVWLFSISLDSLNSSIHDALRGYGSHVRALRSIILLRSLGVPVEIGVTAHKLNYPLEYRKMLRFAKKLGCFVSMSPFECRGRAKRYNLLILIPKRIKIIRIKYAKKAEKVTCPSLYGEVAVRPNGYIKPCIQPDWIFERVDPVLIRGIHIFDFKNKGELPFTKYLEIPEAPIYDNPSCPYWDDICSMCLIMRYWYKVKGLCTASRSQE